MVWVLKETFAYGKRHTPLVLFCAALGLSCISFWHSFVSPAVCALSLHTQNLKLPIVKGMNFKVFGTTGRIQGNSAVGEPRLHLQFNRRSSELRLSCLNYMHAFLEIQL